jgi:hypothetical protein
MIGATAPRETRSLRVGAAKVRDPIASLSYRTQINHSDQLGPARFGSFDAGRSLLRRARVGPENDDTSDHGRNRADERDRIKADCPDRGGQ